MGYQRRVHGRYHPKRETLPEHCKPDIRQPLTPLEKRLIHQCHEKNTLRMNFRLGFIWYRELMQLINSDYPSDAQKQQMTHSLSIVISHHLARSNLWELYHNTEDLFEKMTISKIASGY